MSSNAWVALLTFYEISLDSGSFKWLCTDVSRRFMALRSFQRVVSLITPHGTQGPWQWKSKEAFSQLSLDLKLETPQKDNKFSDKSDWCLPVCQQPHPQTLMVWCVRAFDLLEFIVGGEDGAREGHSVLIGFWLFPFLFYSWVSREGKWFSTTSVIKLFAYSTQL